MYENHQDRLSDARRDREYTHTRTSQRRWGCRSTDNKQTERKVMMCLGSCEQLSTKACGQDETKMAKDGERDRDRDSVCVCVLTMQMILK